MTESEPILTNLLNALKNESTIKINIHNICCNVDPNDVKLSYRRDQIYFDYLIRNGIALEIRGIEVLEAVNRYIVYRKGMKQSE
jgi:hypothetical protein